MGLVFGGEGLGSGEHGVGQGLHGVGGVFAQDDDGQRAGLDDDCAQSFVGRSLKNHYPKHRHNITTALQSHPPMTLRVNRRHGNAESYLEKLAAEGIAAKALDEYAVTLDEAVPVSRLPGFAEGLVSVQDFGALVNS